MTIIDQIEQGNTPDSIVLAADQLGRPVDALTASLKTGRLVSPLNNQRERPLPRLLIGEGVTTKINANIGSSSTRSSLDHELEKLRTAVRYGADTVMDLSTCGHLNEIRRRILQESTVPVGTVPIYQAAALAAEEGVEFRRLTADQLLDPIRKQAEEGVDYVTLHAGVTAALLANLSRQKRRLGIVSRGGSLMAHWMRRNERENPYLEYFDDILEICRRYDVVISLGDGLRPGCIDDANDAAQIDELLTIGSLVKRCREANVQVIVEGPGHMTFDQIEGNIQLQKRICDHAPYYVLGPLPTDIAPGYDHITGAIGGSLAAGYGADFLCYVTPAEHLRLPSTEDVKQGVVSARIAAHAGDLVKKIPGASDADNAVSRCRAGLDWDGQRCHVIDPEAFDEYQETDDSDAAHPCSMCGGLCTYKLNDQDRQL